MPILALLAFGSAACATLLAAAAALRAKRSVSRWTFAAGMVVLAAESFFIGLSATATSAKVGIAWQTWRLVTMSFVPGVWLLFSLTYARGDGAQFRALARRLIIAGLLLSLPCFILRDHALIALTKPAASATGVLRLGWFGVLLNAITLIGAVLVVMNLERTFRASVGTIRWRIKFMLLGVGVLFVARIYTTSQVLVYQGLDLSLDATSAGALIVATVLILRSFFRAGHFDLDVYPSQSVLQNSVTVLVAGTYLLIVGALAKIVTYLGGDAAFPLKALVVLVSLVALVVGLQSDRAKLQLRRFISRNFQRPLYDYRAAWKKFTEGTASHVEQADLCRSLVSLTAEVFQALSVNLWLVNDKKDTLILAGSTSLKAAKADPTVHHGNAVEVIAYLEAWPDPIDIESTNASWAARLRECHPGEFPNGGHRVCVPMVIRGELLGLITVGDRVSGVPFSVQDFDMLKCVGDHAAASLLNVQLSQRLLQAKELEAFQAMAAFFVHDLKNAASTLNLMLKNLPIHFDNPEFRADALRGIGKTVTHINGLIGRLSLLRHELKVELAEGDLNDVVADVLAGLKAPNSCVQKDVHPLPPIPLDREQLNKVVTNLVLNATEASSHNGQVRVGTRQENGWVVLSVEDNGCGMSEEFLSQSLFRPFQTTKKNGLGIGMFQSKMIVEAHGGRITVASQPGKGTNFQVFLRAPVPAN